MTRAAILNTAAKAFIALMAIPAVLLWVCK